jgi:hypothetical protein
MPPPVGEDLANTDDPEVTGHGSYREPKMRTLTVLAVFGCMAVCTSALNLLRTETGVPRLSSTKTNSAGSLVQRLRWAQRCGTGIALPFMAERPLLQITHLHCSEAVEDY